MGTAELGDRAALGFRPAATLAPVPAPEQIQRSPTDKVITQHYVECLTRL